MFREVRIVTVRRRIGLLLALGIALFCLGTAHYASAADMYLAPIGTNAGNCQTQAAPCSSFSYAQNEASNTPGPDTVHLAAGEYLPDLNFLAVPNVTWSGPQAGVPADEQTGDTARVLVTVGGYGFIVQADGIAFDGLTFQSLDYGAANGSFGVYNLSASTVRNTVFTHILTGLYAGAAIEVSGVKFETASDAMYSTAPSATITRSSFAPPGPYAGLVSAANGPVTVTDSNFISGTYGFLTYAGASTVNVHRNRFSPSISNALYSDGSEVDATDNWWGCNAGPNQPGCATVNGPGASVTTTSPRLQFAASAAPDPVGLGASAVITGALDRNSAGDPVAVAYPGATVGFATTLGTLDRASAPIVGGTATATLTAPSEPGTVGVTVALDNQTVTPGLEAVEIEPTITVDDDITVAPSGTSVAVSGTGNPGFSVQVQINGIASGFPVTVGSDGTWTSSVTLGDGDNALQAVQGILVADGPTVVGVFAPIVVSPQADDHVSTTPTVEGSGIPGASVDVEDEDGNAIGSTSVGGCGCFSVTVDPLELGPHTLQVTQTASGLTSAETTVDVTVVPDAPVLTSPVEGDTVWAGVTNFVGTALPGATVSVRTGLGELIASGLADGNGDFELPSAPLPEGWYLFVVDQTSDGFTSPETASIAVTVAPLTPTIEVDRDVAMSSETVHLSGTGFPGAALQIRNNGAEVGTTTVASDGSWSADVTLGDGANELDVVQDGTYTSDAITVQARSAPGVLLPSPDALVRSTFGMRGYGFVDTELTVTDENGVEIGRATATECGCWSLRTTTPLDDGPHTLTVSQTVDGTVRSSTLPVVVSQDALEVTSPVELEPTLAEGLRVTGSGAPGATINVYVAPDDTTPAFTGVAGPDGAFDLPVTIPAGFADVAVTQIPVDGEESDPVELSLMLLLNPPTVSVDGPSTVGEGDTIALSGTAEPDAFIALYVNDDPVNVDVQADANGDWTAAIPAFAGDNAISAAQIELASSAFSFASDPVHVLGVGRPEVTSPQDGDVVPTTFDVSGIALPGATVSVVAGATTLGTATADATTGEWSTTTTTALPYGDRVIAVRQTLGGATGGDASVSVVVVPPAPTITHPDGDEAGDGDIDVAGTADPLSTVDVFLDGASSPAETTDADAEGAFAISVAADPGTYVLRASQRLDAMRSGPLSAARSVTVLPARPTLQLDSAATVAAGDAILVSGQAVPGATVLVDREAPSGTVTTFTATADGFGAWDRSLPAASRTNSITARQQPGGVGSPSLPSRPPVVVTATPLLSPPAFTLPDHARTGALTINGTARPEATVTGTFDGDDVSTTADGTGAWSIEVTVRAGAQAATLRQSATVEGSEETSDGSAPQTVTGVAAPVVTAPVEDAVVATTLTVTGTALPNATVTVENGSGGQLASVTADGDGEYEAPVTLPGMGTYALNVTQTRGGVSSVATVVSVRIPPAAPTFDAPRGFVTGPVRLTGTALANAAIKVYDQSGSTPVATGTADGTTGAYEIEVTRSAGTYQYTVKQSVDGNESAPSVTRDVTVWPTALTITANTPVVGVGTAATVSGAATAGATVRVSKDGATLSTATATGAGRWSTTVTLPGGRHTLDAVQQVGAGQGETVAGPTVTVLPAPTIAAVTSPIDPTVALSGTAMDAVTVVVVDETGRELGTTTSNGSGAWSLTTTAALAPGDHTLKAHARLGGVDGPASAGRAVTVRSPAVDPDPDPDPDPPTTPDVPTTPTPATPTPPPAATPNPPALLFTVAKPTVKKKTTITLPVTLPGAGRVTVTATIKAGGKRVTYATSKTTVRMAGATRFVLKPSRKAKAALKKLKSVKVSIKVTFTPDGSKKATSKPAKATVKGGRARR